MSKILVVLLCCQFFTTIQAQFPKDSVNTRLNEIVVKGIITDKKLNTAISNIEVVPADALKSNDGLQYQNLLNKVSGVFMQSGTLNTNRITIRGIGARSPFATTSIRAYFGDIPLTDGNGISTIEDLELGAVSTIEIHKGPAASSFGVGLGGTIVLTPNFGNHKGLEIGIESSNGSFGLLRNVINTTYGTEKLKSNIIYSTTKSDGYRDNNQYNRETLTALAEWTPNAKNKLEVIANYTDLKAFIPSSLAIEDFTNNPTNAAFTWGAAQGHEDFQSILAGLTWRYNFSDNLNMSHSVFARLKENYEPRPFNILEENSKIFGFRSVINYKTEKFTLGVGGASFFDSNINRTYENLYEEFPAGMGSVRGLQLTHFKEFRNYYNVFTEFEYNWSKKWRFNAGINANITNYLIENENDNSAEEFDFTPVFSPKLGVLYAPTRNVKLTTSISHGFATPTSEETLLPDGIFNPDLEAEQGWNLEFRTNYLSKNKRFAIDLAAYNMFVNDLLVNRRGVNDELFAINAGKTNHFGLEGNLRYEILNATKIMINTYGNFSLYAYKFKEFVDDETDFSGNRLTGVPAEVFNLGVAVGSTLGFYGNIDFQHVGRMPADDANTVFSEAYELINIKVGYEVKAIKEFKINILGGVNNLFNSTYASQLQVNASGFGGNAPRYYYPGNPIHFYTGIRLNYSIL